MVCPVLTQDHAHQGGLLRSPGINNVFLPAELIFMIIIPPAGLHLIVRLLLRRVVYNAGADTLECPGHPT